MFITGITSAICSDDEGSARWWFYGIGCTAGAYVLAASGLCFRSLYSFFKDESARNLVLALGVFFFIGWGVFPIAWTFGHSGLDMVDGLVTGTVYLIGDILAKNLFVITAVVLKARHLTDRPQPWSFLLPWDRASSRWGGARRAAQHLEHGTAWGVAEQQCGRGARIQRAQGGRPQAHREPCQGSTRHHPTDRPSGEPAADCAPAGRGRPGRRVHVRGG